MVEKAAARSIQEIASDDRDMPKVELTIDEEEASVGPGSVKTARFAPLSESAVSAEQSPIDLLADVKLELSVELGRATLPVREVLQVGSGSVIELNRVAGEPVDILVNGKLIARGEVVVVDENFGVRITEITNGGMGLNRAA